VAFGTGDGGFGPASEYDVGRLPRAVAVADLDRDGTLDLVVANTGSGVIAGSDTMSVLFGAGNRSFAQTQTFAGGDGPRSLAIADLDGDGLPDIALADFNPDGTGVRSDVSVLLNTGQQSFAALNAFAVATNPLGIAVADFNGDGAPDLMVGSLSQGTVQVLLHNPAGLSQVAHSTINVAPVNDAPGLTTTPTDPTFTEKAGLGQQADPVALFSATAIDTVEAGQGIVGLNLSVSGLQDGADETLVVDGSAIALVDGAGGTTSAHGLAYTVVASGSSATIAFTDAGSGLTPAVMDGIVDAIAYQNTNVDAPTAGIRTITLTQIQDSGGTANGGTDTTALSTSSGVTVVPVNDPAVVSGVTTGDVTEAGGVDNGMPGVKTATGLLTDTDVDNPPNAFQAVAAGTASDKGYGTFAMTAGGTWTYTLDDSNATVQALNVNDKLTDTFTVQTVDGTTQQMTVTIHGQNDAAVVSGPTSGDVTEAGGVNNGTPGVPTASGVLADTDLDNTPDTFQPVAAGTASDKGYGTFEMTKTQAGAWIWTYTLDDTSAAVQALNLSGTLTDTFTVQTVDGTPQQVTITIHGQNDAAVIAGPAKGAVTEDGFIDDTHPTGSPTVSATLTDSDVDNSANTFRIVAAGAASEHGYGTFGMTQGGTWTFTLDNTNAAVQALRQGQTLTDTFTVHTQDGTAQQVVVTIDGANDKPVVGGVDARVGYDANKGTPALLYTDVTLGDVDSATMSGAQVSISAGFTNGDVLHFVDQSGISGSYDAAAGVLRLSGNASVGAYQAALASITFENPTGQQSGTRTVSLFVTDDTHLTSATDTTAVTVNGLLIRLPDHGRGDTGQPILPPSGPIAPGSDRVITYTPGSFDLPSFGDGLGSAVHIVHADATFTPNAGTSFAVALPLLPFETSLGGEVVTMTASLADGSPLPDWLTFDAQKGAFAGMPPAGMVASLAPDDQSGDTLATGSIPKNTSDVGDKNGQKNVTVEVVARDAHGNLSIMTFTLILQPGGHTWNDRSLEPSDLQDSRTDYADRALTAPDRFGWAIDLDRLARAASAAVARPIATDHGAAQALPGRASLAQQLDRSGWRSLNANRAALLQSLRDGARMWQ
jgi:VCBS repeat-containing protein